MSKTVLNDGDEGVLLILKNARKKRAKRSGPVTSSRAPVHVVYGGAHLFRSDTPQKLGRIAVGSLEALAPNFVEFAAAMGLQGAETLKGSAKDISALGKQISQNETKVKAENYPAWLAWAVHRRTLEKLQNEPVEDFRIDFEDGYGFRTDADEDSDAIACAEQLSEAFRSGSITQFSGIRIKSFAPETRDRAVRTLKLFLDTLLRSTKNKLPGDFVVTLPKVSDRKQVKGLCKHLKKIEKVAGLSEGSIGIELVMEHPLAFFDRKGNVALRPLVEAAKGRCTSAHFGAYDFTASLGIAASHQGLRHASCDFARQMMLATLAPMGLRLSDSVTTQMPVAVHRGTDLSNSQVSENRDSIVSGWRAHYSNVTRSMIDGFYQSWDLHPNQLVARYAAVYSFFLETADAQARRLREFVAKAAQANLTGNTFDDAASAQGLINFFLRGIDCGAIKEAEAAESTGLSMAELRSASFLAITAKRRNAGS